MVAPRDVRRVGGDGRGDAGGLAASGRDGPLDDAEVVPRLAVADGEAVAEAGRPLAVRPQGGRHGLVARDAGPVAAPVGDAPVHDVVRRDGVALPDAPVVPGATPHGAVLDVV